MNNKKDLNCQTCLKEIKQKHFNTKYCNWNCNPLSFKQKNPSIFCATCGVKIENPHPRTKYCSVKCYPYAQQGFRSQDMRDKYKIKSSDPDWHKESLRKSRERSRNVKIFLRKIKLEKGCIDCGYKFHHAALQFDHVKGEKQMNVCHAKSISSAQMEIEKCEIVCANCHQIRTFNRLINKIE